MSDTIITYTLVEQNVNNERINSYERIFYGCVCSCNLFM